MTTIARSDLAKVLAQRTLDVEDSSLLAHEIAAFLLTENRTADLESLLRDIMQIRAEQGIIEAVAISAHELTEQVLDDIKDILKQEFPNAKEIIVRERRDPKVVGGLNIKMANEHLDMTVQSKLNTFKRLTAQERK